MNTWNQYYKEHKPEEIPWKGVNSAFFDEIWKRFKLPQHGKLLDIGCGTGEKSLYLAEKGFEVYGIDISPYAIKQAKSHKVKNCIFTVGDIAQLSKVEEIQNKSFDIILDLSVSQFLSQKQKVEYIKQLNDFISTVETFYILLTFAKDDKKDTLEGEEKWIKKIAQSPEDVLNVYGKRFSVLGSKRMLSNKGKSDLYVMKTK